MDGITYTRIKKAEANIAKYVNVVLTNNFINGNAVDGTDGWLGNANTAVSASENGITAINTSDGSFNLVNSASIKGSVGDKIYISFMASGVKECRSVASNASAYPVFNFYPSATPTRFSYITTLGVATTFNHRFYIVSSKTGNALTISKAIHINLTSSFGAGREPTRGEIDRYVEQVGGWFDGDIRIGTTQSDISRKEVEKLSINLTNKFVNSDFTLGLGAWNIKNGVAEGNGEVSCLAEAKYDGIRQLNTIDAGNIYYIKCDVKADSDQIRLALGAETVFHSGGGEYETLSLLSVATTTQYQFVSDLRTSGFTRFYMKKPILINLTEEFGIGLEPTIEQIEHILSAFPDKYFAGEANVNIGKNMMRLYLKDVADLRERMVYDPPYVRPMIEDVAARVGLAQGLNSLTFGFITDTHAGQTSTLYRWGTIAEATKHIPMSFIVHGGDIVEGNESKETEIQKMHNIAVRLNESKVPVFYVTGNHDDGGFYASARSETGEVADPPWIPSNYISALDIYNQTTKFSERWIHGAVPEGCYYYHDDAASKIRTLFLNVQDIPYVEEDGLKSLDFRNQVIGDDQLNWIANTGLNFSEKDDPTEWAVIVCSHTFGTWVKNYDVLTAMLDAFTTGGAYTGSGNFTITDPRTSEELSFPWSVSVDFASQGAVEFIAFFAGDYHLDRIRTLNEYTIVEVLNASTSYNKGVTPEKTPRTATETAWDVVTINRTTNTINMTRFGAGEDRITMY